MKTVDKLRDMVYTANGTGAKVPKFITVTLYH